MKGFDLQADVVITDNWTLETAVGYTRAMYDAPPAIAAGFVSAGDTIGGPPWTVAIGTQYNFQALGLPWFARADYELSTRNNRLTPGQNPTNDQVYDPYNFTLPQSTFVSLRSAVAVGAWNVSAFVDNLLNKQIVTGFDHSVPGPDDPSDIMFSRLGIRPRTIGLTVTFRN